MCIWRERFSNTLSFLWNPKNFFLDTGRVWNIPTWGSPPNRQRAPSPIYWTLPFGFYFLFKEPDFLCSLWSIVCLVWNSEWFTIIVSCLDFGLSSLLLPTVYSLGFDSLFGPFSCFLTLEFIAWPTAVWFTLCY